VTFEFDGQELYSGAMPDDWWEHEAASEGLPFPPGYAAKLAAQIDAEGVQGRLNRQAELDREHASGATRHRKGGLPQGYGSRR
jgi:hypothetical protein